jgi:DNA-binding NtrC family response regulator
MVRNLKILIVDDDQGVLYTAKMILKQHYSQVDTEGNPVAAYEKLKKDPYDIIILDMNFRRGATSGEEGIDWLKKILELQPDIQVIMDTAYGDINLAVQSMKEGAVDFITKPWDKEKLLTTVYNAYNLLKSRKEIKSLQSKQKILLEDANSEFIKMIGKDSSMKVIRKTISKVSKTEANLLILGENGTGKELVARMIHQQSLRRDHPFIKVDLGAIPETLFESELFGHKKGAFTDAKEDRIGRFELAEGGTLFLDEIGNLDLYLQAKLLSVLQTKTINRVGSSELIPINIRLVCATNKNLEEEILLGNFRQDLLYRINTIEMILPPLREKKQDIPLLINHYLSLYSTKYQKEKLHITDDTYSALIDFEWPGNIRELKHAVERAVILAESNKLAITDFIPASHLKVKGVHDLSDSVKMKDVEKKTIMEALEKNDGNQSLAAKELGIGRTTLYRKMKKYNINF